MSATDADMVVTNQSELRRVYRKPMPALIRSRLWDPEVQIDRSSYSTYGQVLADQIAGADAKAIDADEDEANRNQLY